MAAELTVSPSCAYHGCEPANGHSACPRLAEYVRALEALVPEHTRPAPPPVSQDGR